jgi:oxepin-CoA hydrolase / 3-oxo-5,6-dehydrosuberyl-CoA semialdehyde dehydrogenase
MITLQSHVGGRWVAGEGPLQTLVNPATEEPLAQAGSGGIDRGAALEFARSVGGKALRAMSFAERGALLKAMCDAIQAHRDEILDLAVASGGNTRSDAKFDVDGATFTLSAYAEIGRGLGDARVLVDGEGITLGRTPRFHGQHIAVPRAGVAVHVNAFNFPAWGFAEKAATALLAGMPVLTKPAQSTALVAHRIFEILTEKSVLPEGALSLLVGSVGDLLSHVGAQDVVAFTGSGETGVKIRSLPNIIKESVRVNVEADSLNAAILGPDVEPGSETWDFYLKDVLRDMTQKAGQKCTAIRRALVPAGVADRFRDELADRLKGIVVGNPAQDGVRMGPVATADQLKDVREGIDALARDGRLVYGVPDLKPVGVEPGKGFFVSPVLIELEAGAAGPTVHTREVFGPVATVVPYSGQAEEAAGIVARGNGGLVSSVYSEDAAFTADVVLGLAPYHGRVFLGSAKIAEQSPGPGTVLPTLVHGGPGRAGGGEEMGGIRGVKHYMQRTALQGGPEMLSKIVKQWLPGAEKVTGDVHPFRKRISELEIGYTLKTGSRTVTLDDIEHFAHFTGDTFYAHMDEEAATASPIFGGRVAHGYLILSFAAGLFVDPDPGPVLANTGLESLRFLTPLYPGDAMRVELTVKSTSIRDAEKGEVRWAVEVFNQKDEIVATYELMTMNVP